MFGRLFLFYNNVLGNKFYTIGKLFVFSIKWGEMCEEKAFEGGAAELSMWVCGILLLALLLSFFYPWCLTNCWLISSTCEHDPAIVVSSSLLQACMFG